MDALAIIAIIGGIALFAGLFNGITAQQFTVHALPVPTRLISSIVGIILISAVLYRVYSSPTSTTQGIPTPINTQAQGQLPISSTEPSVIPESTILAPTLSEPASNIVNLPTAKPPPTEHRPEPTIPPSPVPTPILEPTMIIPPLKGLTPDEVRSWCQGNACYAQRFEQLKEANGFVNPLGVRMKTGDSVSFDIPQGISVDIWDCFKASRVTGSVHLPQVCEASFRREE